MPRPKLCRRVCGFPRCMSFAPEDDGGTGFVVLTMDEYETIRLVDYEKLTHSQCAEQMRVSRTTVTDIYERARHKIAECLVNGRKLVIAGGDYRFDGPESEWQENFPQQKEDGTMRVAVTYQDGQVFQHFGRTEEFKIYDVKDGNVEELGILRSGDYGHGALAGLLGTANADALICGGIGGGAQMALAQEGIDLYAGVSGSADEAVRKLANGTLEYSDSSNCSHHQNSDGSPCGPEDGSPCGSHNGSECCHR
ncbi:MAG: DUF134 domain-containing protein [Coriobacteriales bacterium]|jgi:predicted DNA-binding protein (UPF0251 family)/predicted Fe-Mo cluster-binding NifX family protein